MNKVILIGRLTKDPELRYTPNGVAVSTYTLAVDRPKSQNGEKEADFIPIVAWQKTADIVAEYCRKGKRCAVEGRLQTRSYDNKEGKRVYVTEVVAERVQIIDWPEGSSGGRNNDWGGGDPFADTGKPINISDDDLPF